MTEEREIIHTEGSSPRWMGLAVIAWGSSPW